MAIINDQIGGHHFIRLDGDIEHESDELVEITRPGVDGVAYQKLGKRGRVTGLAGFVIARTAFEASALINTYAALRGDIVTIVLKEIARKNYLVVDAGGFERAPIATSVGGTTDGGVIVTLTSGWIVASTWQLQYVG